MVLLKLHCQTKFEFLIVYSNGESCFEPNRGLFNWDFILMHNEKNCTILNGPTINYFEINFEHLIMYSLGVNFFGPNRG